MNISRIARDERAGRFQVPAIVRAVIPDHLPLAYDIDTLRGNVKALNRE